MHQQLANGGRAGEGQAIDAHVHRQVFAEAATGTRQYVEHTIRQAGLGRKLCHANSRQRCIRRGLQDHGITGCNGRRKLPGRRRQRKIPRHDRGHHTQWQALHESQRVGRCWRYFVVPLVDRLAAPARRPNSCENIDIQRVIDRLADIKALEERQFFLMFLNELCPAQHDHLAIGRGHTRPHATFKRFARNADCEVSVFGTAIGHWAQVTTITGAHIRAGFAG